MTQNYFQGTVENPYHISIGAVVVNDKKEVCCHYFRKFSHPGVGTFEDFYILMRETLEPGETIETCLARGLKEEFGIEASLHHFLGSIVSRFFVSGSDAVIEKTTLYFLCDLVTFNEDMRASDDHESESEICWLPKEQLIAVMKEQGKRLGREDADESAILERL